MNLFTKQIEDKYIRDNFLKLEETLNTLVFVLGDFKFFEFKITGEHSRYKLFHNLGFKPNDVLVTKAIGSPYDFFYELFDSETLTIQTTGDLYLRCFIGNMKGDEVSGPRAGMIAPAGPGAGIVEKIIEVDASLLVDRTIVLQHAPPPGNFSLELNGLGISVSDYKVQGSTVVLDEDLDIDLGDEIKAQYTLA